MHFYGEHFGIITGQDPSSQTLGYYCDILTPLRREADQYFLIDLILALWIYPDLSFIELDRDEFSDATLAGVMPPDDGHMNRS